MNEDDDGAFFTSHVIAQPIPGESRGVALFLCLLDPCTDGPSLTNLMEGMTLYARDMGTLVAGMRVVYRDSLGMWDEVLIDDECAFVGFNVLNAKDERDAIIASLTANPNDISLFTREECAHIAAQGKMQ